jgi:predicted GNAT family acetyltransferase
VFKKSPNFTDKTGYMEIQIQHHEEKNRGIFFVGIENERVAEMTYFYRGKDKIVIDQTSVSDKLRGQGIAKRLLVEAVGFARNNNLKIIPVCSFVRDMFHKVDDYRDVTALDNDQGSMINDQ